MADRQLKERKLVALMLNDMEAGMDREDLSRAEQEVQDLPDEELNRLLASRLNLPDPTDEAALDDALIHVTERETDSDSPGDLTEAPDMSHNPGPGENADA